MPEASGQVQGDAFITDLDMRHNAACVYVYGLILSIGTSQTALQAHFVLDDKKTSITKVISSESNDYGDYELGLVEYIHSNTGDPESDCNPMSIADQLELISSKTEYALNEKGLQFNNGGFATPDNSPFMFVASDSEAIAGYTYTGDPHKLYRFCSSELNAVDISSVVASLPSRVGWLKST